ncbi:MAG: hypothetical protein LBD96_00400 [Treponema sp.]|jgi:hypothetical protein|nr:hypothetical protein [Treponema sp.]
MLLRKHVPKQEIRALRKGDFYVDGEIVSINKTPRMVSIITSAGNLYNAHMKTGDYTVFRVDRYRRKMERESWKR